MARVDRGLLFCQAGGGAEATQGRSWCMLSCLCQTPSASALPSTNLALASDCLESCRVIDAAAPGWRREEGGPKGRHLRLPSLLPLTVGFLTCKMTGHWIGVGSSPSRPSPSFICLWVFYSFQICLAVKLYS